MKYKAILFDMDGVLISSSKATREAFIRVIEERTGVTARPDDFKPFTGSGEGEALKGVCEKYGVKFREDMKEQVYEIYRTDLFEKIEVFEKIPETLEALKKKGYIIIIASSADMIKVETNLKRAGIGEDMYDGIICGSQVERRKPFPDVYIEATRLSGIEPSLCVAVEDAVSGVKAAASAGIDCIGITSVFDRETLSDAGCMAVCEKTCDLSEIL